ncbi:hypothetical protein ACP70R_015907 [Stipagrostis hirtigluma subsp. patula]
MGAPRPPSSSPRAPCGSHSSSVRSFPARSTSRGASGRPGTFG